MDTPIADFVRRYAESGAARLHMPGHKGAGPLGCEALDITEIPGADVLYDDGEGIIARSEANAAALFGSGATFYSTEGSSLCIRAMLTMALLRAGGQEGRPTVLAARNAHKTLLLAAAVLDVDIRWLWPEREEFSLCACPITAEGVRRQLAEMADPPIAVFVTSPDYLGGMLDIAAIAEAAHEYGVPLLVDNAHGAYLHFLGLHPMDLGADLCCDSAHKTLPVLTGGAYLHVGKTAPAEFFAEARRCLSLFASTSPSYLILQSLDLANAALAAEWSEQLKGRIEALKGLKGRLGAMGWLTAESDPLKLSIRAADCGWNGPELAEALRSRGIACEYADPDFVVMMITPSNPASDLYRLESAFSALSPRLPLERPRLRMAPPRQTRTPRQAILSAREILPVEKAVGRVLADPTVSCPPAVPVVVSGEVIAPDALPIFARYGITHVAVMR